MGRGWRSSWRGVGSGAGAGLPIVEFIANDIPIWLVVRIQNLGAQALFVTIRRERRGGALALRGWLVVRHGTFVISMRPVGADVAKFRTTLSILVAGKNPTLVAPIVVHRTTTRSGPAPPHSFDALPCQSAMA